MPHSENITKPTLVSSTAGSTTTPDPFDLESLRLNPSFLETTGVKKLITTVPVRRPSPQDFVRVHPSPKYRDNFAVVDLKEDREDYLVRPEIIPEQDDLYRDQSARCVLLMAGSLSVTG